MDSRRLERLLRMRRIEESEATRQLGARLQQLDAVETQRSQLEGYQLEYLRAPLPDDTNQLKWLSGMRDQLRHALEQQDLRAQAAGAQAEQARQEWLLRHRAVMSLEKLLERRIAEQEREADRRRQHEQDMWATRQVHTRTQDANNDWQES
ncbi:MULTISPECIES: flagellar export protein FliJ [unclassified Thioalkalivibrio]|uniref:flagellar export protein FliJ n=1 Tax=unclassified Thioalkalivibrio TaxID=2621013 RepID=UPI0003A308DB|nr:MULTISPECIES: flagellar FliJ family protein [unclassified Thioalkalivibrio]